MSTVYVDGVSAASDKRYELTSSSESLLPASTQMASRSKPTTQGKREDFWVEMEGSKK